MQDRDTGRFVFAHVGLGELEMVARRLLDPEQDIQTLIFYGELGAGKTTLIKVLCRLLGVTETVTSPSFSIVNEYHTQDGRSIYHFDFYRIREGEEALDIGFDEYLHSGNYCFIEWPEKVIPYITTPYIAVHMVPETGNLRTISASVHGREEKE